MPSAFAIAAHPDDIEFVMAGTLIRLKQAGYDLHYMTIANGSCGSTELSAAHTAELRERESLAAADFVGAEFHPSLTSDLAIFFDRQTLARLAAIVRKVAPEILLVHAPADYMEDHVNACRLAVTAAFARGMHNFPTIPPTEPIDQPVTVYHAQPHGNRDPLGQIVRPGLFVDIGSVLEQKTAMLACHQSQQAWLDASQGLGSYLETMKALSREVGEMSGRFEYAEGWRKRLHLGFCAADADPLAAALGESCALIGSPSSGFLTPPLSDPS
ncbi:MAG TPA: PIG-L family deacetylase [Pirellulales bacterium]|nr:PIG-L family deacetylase [Pirellulales bacterium]